MTGQVARTAQGAAVDTCRRFDAALRAIGIAAGPSIVSVARVDGVRVNKISPPELSLHQATRLATIMEAMARR